MITSGLKSISSWLNNFMMPELTVLEFSQIFYFVGPFQKHYTKMMTSSLSSLLFLLGPVSFGLVGCILGFFGFLVRLGPPSQRAEDVQHLLEGGRLLAGLLHGRRFLLRRLEVEASPLYLVHDFVYCSCENTITVIKKSFEGSKLG